jgi:GNAT superfamily N-acetyltransferase
VGELRLDLCRARLHDLGAISGLLREASLWLRTKRTDQWAEDWPSEDIRRKRVRAAIRAGRTWIAWDARVAAATVTASPNHHGIWPEENRRDPAVYVRRLVVSRRYAGLGLGAQLLDWAGLRVDRHYGAAGSGLMSGRPTPCCMTITGIRDSSSAGSARPLPTTRRPPSSRSAPMRSSRPVRRCSGKRTGTPSRLVRCPAGAAGHTALAARPRQGSSSVTGPAPVRTGSVASSTSPIGSRQGTGASVKLATTSRPPAW